jgi:hypothetical protein
MDLNIFITSIDKPFHTDGKGLWSKCITSVMCLDAKVIAYPIEDDDDDEFGEMQIHFDPETWICTYKNVIYTDPLFLAEVRTYFKNKGVLGKIHYSERGMQGNDFVSFDVDAKFVNNFRQLAGVQEA